MKSNNVAKGKMIASILGICIATILIIVAFCGRYADGGFKQFGNFFLGSFGMSFYGIMAAIIVACSFSLAGKSLKIPVKYAIFFALTFVSIVLLVHIWTTTYLPKDFYNDTQTGYVQLVYNYYDSQIGIPTFGGVVFGSIAYGLTQVLYIWGASLVILALLALSVFFVGDFFYAYFTNKLTLQSKTDRSDIEPTEETVSTPAVTGNTDDSRQRAFEILFEGQTYPEEVSSTPSEQRFETSPQSKLDSASSDRSQAADLLFGANTDTTQRKVSGGNIFFRPVNTETPKQEDDEFIVRGYYNPSEPVENKTEKSISDWKVSTPEDTTRETYATHIEPIVEHKTESLPIREQPQVAVANETVDIVDLTVEDEQPTQQAEPLETEHQADPVVIKPDSYEEDVIIVDVASDDEPVTQHPEVDKDEVLAIPKETVIKTSAGEYKQDGFDFITRGEFEEEQQRVHKFAEYMNPPFELLDDITIVEDDNEDRQRIADAIVNKLSVFGIKIEVADIVVGPAVTRYMFNVLSQKTRMSEFARFADDIKACVEAHEGIIIEAPVHGTNQVGIDVPNKIRRPVVLRSILESETFKKFKGDLIFALGQEITGKIIVADLADMPHLLIAGSTGSGKSVALNCLIVSLMYKYGPEYVRFLMVDPKFVELSRYNGIPHMLTSEAIVNINDALAGLDYLINEMDARYQLFRSNGVGNIGEYNEIINPKITQRLPYLVFIVDELADLMAVSKQAFETKLQRLAAMARAAGIHIVLATQRPDVKTITGTIKANLPCRMAFKVVTQVDSNTIIGRGGAEKLLGKGDMLYMSSKTPVLARVQGALVTTNEIRALVKFSKDANEVYYDEKVSDEIFVSRKQAEAANLEQESAKDDGSKETQLDPYCKKALRFWLEKQGGRASIASIQRNLGIGFNRAGRIMDSLQKLKYVEELSPSDPSSKPLKVLITLEELDDLFPDMQG